MCFRKPAYLRSITGEKRQDKTRQERKKKKKAKRGETEYSLCSSRSLLVEFYPYLPHVIDFLLMRVLHMRIDTNMHQKYSYARAGSPLPPLPCSLLPFLLSTSDSWGHENYNISSLPSPAGSSHRHYLQRVVDSPRLLSLFFPLAFASFRLFFQLNSVIHFLFNSYFGFTRHLQRRSPGQ